MRGKREMLLARRKHCQWGKAEELSAMLRQLHQGNCDKKRRGRLFLVEEGGGVRDICWHYRGALMAEALPARQGVAGNMKQRCH